MGTRAYARNRAASAGLAVGLLLAGSLLVGLPASAATEGQRPLIELIKIENGTRDTLDGGDYTAIVVGSQVFGVLYGSADHPFASVTLFTVFPRSLGTATVRDADSGRLVARSVTLPVATLIGQRMDAIFEFRDQNGDGMFNFRPNNATRDPIDINASEPVFKSVDLSGDWNLSEFDLTVVSDNQVNMTLKLTRDDIEYRRPFDQPQMGDGVLNRVEFTVKISITRQRVEGASVPHFQATVRRTDGERELASLERDGNATASYTSMRATFKVDHDIVGWDFAPPRETVESMLFLRTTIVYANAVNARLAPWLNERAFDGGRAGEANVSDESTRENITISRDPNGTISEFRPATSVGLRDAWGRTASIGWVPTVQVWANETSEHPVLERVHFQVLGGAPFRGTTENHTFAGFVLIGGYVYPVGYRIYHDPQLEAQSVELDGTSVLPKILPGVILAGEAVLVIGALIGVLALAGRASSKGARAQAAKDAQRLDALKARYKLPDPVQPPTRGGGAS